VVVGAGPAGLAAAVYARPKGSTCWCSNPTRQGGSRRQLENRKLSRISHRISGERWRGALIRRRRKFGAEVAIARSAVKLRASVRSTPWRCQPGGSVKARSLVIATGVQYRKLPLSELPRFEGLGVYYARPTWRHSFARRMT